MRLPGPVIRHDSYNLIFRQNPSNCNVFRKFTGRCLPSGLRKWAAAPFWLRPPSVPFTPFHLDDAKKGFILIDDLMIAVHAAKLCHGRDVA